MNKPLLIRNLIAARDWAASHRDAAGKAGDPWEAENIMIGCIQVIAQCGQRVDGWLGRKKRRATLKNIREKYNTPVGSRALVQLAELAIETVEACSWKDSFRTGALPIKHQPQKRRPMTDSQLANLQKGWRRKDRQQEALELRLSVKAA